MTNSPRVLVVDDEVVFQMVVQHILHELGYTQLPLVTRGDRAIEVIRRENPDCVLLDILLEGPLTGIDVAKEVRTFSDVPFIIISGYPEEDVLREVEGIRNARFLAKPVLPADLEKALSACFLP